MQQNESDDPAACRCIVSNAAVANHAAAQIKRCSELTMHTIMESSGDMGTQSISKLRFNACCRQVDPPPVRFHSPYCSRVPTQQQNLLLQVLCRQATDMPIMHLGRFGRLICSSNQSEPCRPQNIGSLDHLRLSQEACVRLSGDRCGCNKSNGKQIPPRPVPVNVDAHSLTEQA